MATRLKTVHYAFPALAALTNNTLTTLTQITLYLPESSKVFRSVVARLTCDDIITATGGTLTTKTFNLRLGAAAYTSVANANTLTNTGENMSLSWAQEFTTHFTTNWTGTSMTCDCQIQLNQSTGTTLGMVNVCVTLEITYEYDDTSATHVKSVWIPLNMNAGAMNTVATTRDTIPALDTYLPEASKVYRDIFVVVQGVEGRNTATADYTMTLRVGAASVTTGNYEGALASDRLVRYIWRLTGSYPDTSVTQTWQPTASAAVFNHMQAWMVVTYEYDEATTTSVMNSVVLPLSVGVWMGGTTSGDYHRALHNFWVQEPGPVSLTRLAFFAFWSQTAAIGGLNFRVDLSGSFVAYTDVASIMCGSNAAMIRNDTAITLQRGLNVLNFDAYRTDTTDLGVGVSGFFILNYTSGKSAKGTGAHNHTVFYSIAQCGTAAAATLVSVAAKTIPIPETTYFINNLGIQVLHVASNGSTPSLTVQAERLSGESGIAWETVCNSAVLSDPETGAYHAYSSTSLFLQHPNQAFPLGMNPTASRRYRLTTLVGTGWFTANWVVTYHDITYTVGGNITGFTGTVDLDLTRRSDSKLLQKTSRSGDGAYAFTVYDNTDPVYVAASDGTNKGVTLALPAPGSP